MLRAITVDDESSNQILLKRFIEESGLLKVVGHFTDPLFLIEEVEAINPDVVFLDIEMPVLSGLEVAEMLAPICPDVKIVFVTAYSQYAVEAFRVNALDYLLKPIDPGEMNRVIHKLIDSVSTDVEPAIESNVPHINCLGEFSVFGTKSSREVQWITSKVEELLAYLLRNSPQTVSKAELCNVLWKDFDEEKGLVSLYTTVYRLRKSLIEAGVPIRIISGKNGYQAENAGCLIDYKEFERLTEPLVCIGTSGVTHENRDSLVAAELLFKGELFFGRPYLWSAPYAETINQRYKLLCYGLYGYFSEQKDIASAAAYLDKILKVFPDEERACMLRMKIFAALKNESAAEKLYQSYVSYLKDELDVVPSQEFEAFYASLFI